MYFTDDGKAYALGIIDSLTGYDFTKKGEKFLKSIRYASEETPEGFWGVSCLPPDQYAERFKNFFDKSLLSTQEQPKVAPQINVNDGDEEFNYENRL